MSDEAAIERRPAAKAPIRSLGDASVPSTRRDAMAIETV